MGLFYTGKGDRGTSDLGGGFRADKTSLEMSVLGNLDELNSLIGLIRSRETSDHTKRILKDIQEDLFIVQANIAFLMLPLSKHQPPEMKYSKIEKLEKLINEFEAMVQPEKGFIIAGENERSAWLDFARATSRRAERSTLHLHKKKTVPDNILAFLNRLSSLLFALARVTAKEVGQTEAHPGYQ
jgi:cob(I)alamin adenosyltransferase